ncbi:hypothetical protein ACIQXD_02400 [Streptomyces uncialis]
MSRTSVRGRLAFMAAVCPGRPDEPAFSPEQVRNLRSALLSAVAP